MSDLELSYNSSVEHTGLTPSVALRGSLLLHRGHLETLGDIFGHEERRQRYREVVPPFLLHRAAPDFTKEFCIPPMPRVIL